MKDLLITKKTFDMPEEWHDTVEYISSIIPPEMHIDEIRLVKNKKKGPHDAAFFIEFDLVNTLAKKPYTITRQFNALAARNHLKKLKNEDNLN